MQQTRLNMGCGDDYREGYINLDLGNESYLKVKINPDVSHDLNKAPFPFEDNQFEEILIYEVLENIKDFEMFFSELSRISKPDCIIKITVPYFSYWGTYAEFSIHKFCLNCRNLFHIFKRNGLKLISKKVVNSNKFLKILDYFVNSSDLNQRVYERFFSGIFPARQVEWILRRNKRFKYI